MNHDFRRRRQGGRLWGETSTTQDAVILAVAHTEFKSLSMTDIDKLYGEGRRLIDVKGLLNRKEYEDAGYCYWRL